MKITNCLATATMLAGIFCSASTQTSSAIESGSTVPTVPDYAILLTQPTHSFRLASPIQVTMTIKNITDKSILWRAFRGNTNDSWYADFRFLLTKDGKEVETTFFHRKISGRQRSGDPVEVLSGSTILLPKPPGTIFVITVDVNHLYRINKPGKYLLEISRVAEDGKTIVHSNSVAIDIEP